MAALSITGALVLKGEYSNDKTTPGVTLPVMATPGTHRTLVTCVVPVDPGDVLDVDARARVTNDTGVARGDDGYTVGTGANLWAYDADPEPDETGKVPEVADRPWTPIAPSWGENVTRDLHHLPIDVTAHWQVPATWPAGHRAVIVLRANAHSTAAVSGDTLTVDAAYTLIKVSRKGLAPA